jgi:hypothetical protein
MQRPEPHARAAFVRPAERALATPHSLPAIEKE